MEARAVPSHGPSDTQGLLGKSAKKGRVRKRSTALSSRSSAPAALSCWAGAPGIPGSPGHQPLPGSWRPRDTGTTTAADCIPRPRRRPPPALTRACASRSGPAAPAGSRAPLARGDQAAHAVDEPARAAWLGPPQRSPTGHATGLPMQGAEEWGVGVGGGGRWGVGVGERRVSWDWPGLAATHSTAGREWLPGRWDRPGRTRVCSDGDGTRGKGPRAAGSGSFTAASSSPARTRRPPGSRVPATPGARARGPCAHARPYSLRGARPVPGRALDLRGTRAPADDLTPSSPSSPGRDRAWSPGIRKAGPLDGSIAPRNASLPFPRPHPRPLPPPFARGKKLSQAKTETNKRNQPQGTRAVQEGQQEVAREAGHFGGVGEGCASQSGAPPCSASNAWGPVRLLGGPGSHDFSRGQPGSEPVSGAAPLATWVSPRHGETRPHGPRHTQPGLAGLIQSGA